jgi:hypothetical protein
VNIDLHTQHIRYIVLGFSFKNSVGKPELHHFGGAGASLFGGAGDLSKDNLIIENVQFL